ncbi:hypothetical protein HWD03_gp102 [Alteromonas phage vB_AmeM_PT11-V22]|uniref:Uncharacterized protein n=1 Tax=Alteromonas phage vB_AmeM_PT11-V22 TaxID=2704031 RepID=A0A6C0R2Z9_9CAUD|nr:hypothetical protein HWD03_gp102 [Alteromonas phage vB_AmeM_PT11-V22]QHZ59782.1 hypothetical protein [Alteromonas phage vB_AmeM_PT11-V22]
MYPADLKADQFFKSIILQVCDNESYNDQVLTTEAEKIQFLKDTFYSELGWSVERVGLRQACQNWLQGLASACTVPFYNGEIIELYEASLGRKLLEREEDRILFSDTHSYWYYMGLTLAGMFKNN